VPPFGEMLSDVQEQISAVSLPDLMCEVHLDTWLDTDLYQAVVCKHIGVQKIVPQKDISYKQLLCVSDILHKTLNFIS